MFRKNFTLFSFAVFVLLVSCQKKADTLHEGATKKFNITVGNKYIDSITQKWVFITDKNGISSQAYKLTNNSSVSINLPNSYAEGDKYTLNVLSYYTYFTSMEVDGFELESTTDMAPGDYKLKVDSTNIYTSVRSTHFMTVDNMPVDGNPTVGSFGKNVTGNDASYNNQTHQWTTQTTFIGDTTDITYYGSFSHAWKYIIVPRVTNNQTTEVDYSDMKSMENHVEFQFDNSYVAHCSTYGVTNKDYLHKTTLNASSYLNTSPVTSLVYYYPTTSFDQYITEVSLRTSTIYQTEYTLGNTVASNFTGWNGRVLSANIQSGNLITELSQDADILYCSASSSSVSNGKQFYFGWTITTSGEKNKTIKLPALPSQLATQFPQWSTYTPHFGSITAVKTNVADPYNDYISNRFIKDGSYIFPYFFYPSHQRVVIHTQTMP